MIEAITLASLWLTLPLFILGALLIFSTFYEEGEVSLIVFGIITALVIFGFDGVLSSIITNPFTAFTYLGMYLVIGFLWSLFRWYKKLKMKKAKGATTVPKAEDYKEEILLWISIWPLDTFFYVVRDFIGDILRTIWDYTKNIYQKVSNHVFKGL